ncbi:hypothetical protein NUW58_g6190 [Xylaria curta]|uniref:Uncharacterized protein n=1 Tax=Xylaria curta TaxID=42375 RepID=A0ACC1NXW0_9PEZI|nr:hypothetical protein NUW58_g6190 [Xylaria curta]
MAFQRTILGPAPRPTSPRFCVVCNDPTYQACPVCRSAYYCSAACRQSDRSIHTRLCKTFFDFESKHPPKTHFRAILFPCASRAQLIWLETRTGEEGHRRPDTSPWLSSGSEFSQRIEYDYVLDKPLLDAVYLTYGKDQTDSSKAPLNKCIRSHTATEATQYKWHGPVIAYAMQGNKNPTEYRDIDMKDFRHIINHFTLNGPQIELTIPPAPPEPTIKGIRINCIGDVAMFGKIHYEQIELLETDSIFTTASSSQIAARLELPLLTRFCVPHSL